MKVISPEDYDDEYYLSECNGYREFSLGDNSRAPRRLQVIWNIASLSPEMKLLDAGCGRGEILSKCIHENIFSVGVDYSKYALRIARNFLVRNCKGESESIRLIRGDLRRLPLANNLFDCVIMSDVIEHIHPKYILDVLVEIRRILRINGKLVVHTMPNLWYYRFGYPLFRLVELLRGNKLPQNPRDRYKFSHFHVNEQTPHSLNSILREAGFKTKVWLYDYRSYSEYPILMRLCMRFVTRAPLLNAIFCDDIFAVATKTHD